MEAEREDNGAASATVSRIVEQERGGHEVGMPLGVLTEAYVEQMEHQVALFNRVRLALFRATNDEDWTDFSGKPYLQDPGVNKLAHLAGIEFGIPKIYRENAEDPQGKFVRFRCELTATWRSTGRMSHQVGTSSTRDVFFGKEHGKLIPLSDIILGDVEKKCITNAKHRSLDDLLAIDGLSWRELSKLGLEPKGGTVRHKGSEQRSTVDLQSLKKDQERLWVILLHLTAGDATEAQDRLFKATDNPPQYKGFRDVSKIPAGVMKWLLPKAEKEYEKVMGEPLPSTPEKPQAGAAPPAGG